MKQNSKSLPVQMSNTIIITLKNNILKVTVNRYQSYLHLNFTSCKGS